MNANNRSRLLCAAALFAAGLTLPFLGRAETQEAGYMVEVIVPGADFYVYQEGGWGQSPVTLTWNGRALQARNDLKLRMMNTGGGIKAWLSAPAGLTLAGSTVTIPLEIKVNNTRLESGIGQASTILANATSEEARVPVYIGPAAGADYSVKGDYSGSVTIMFDAL